MANQSYQYKGHTIAITTKPSAWPGGIGYVATVDDTDRHLDQPTAEGAVAYAKNMIDAGELVAEIRATTPPEPRPTTPRACRICGEYAPMNAALGPACYEHFDELSN